jgi:hypothetical protein
MKTYYPDTSHEMIVVEGVDHNGDDMINSPEVINYLREVLD